MGESLIPFVDTINQQAGSINNVASGLTKLTQAQSEITNILGQVDNVLGNMDTVLPPSLPDMGDINSAISEAQGTFYNTMSDVTDLAGLAGSCLDGAMSAIYDVSRDAYSLVDSSMDNLNDVNGMPRQMVDIYKAYNEARAMIDKLGLEKMIADIVGNLGCLQDSSLIDTGVGQIQSITASLGLNPDGTVPNTYYDQLKTKMTELGFDTSYADDMKNKVATISTEATTMMNEAKVIAKEKIATVKTEIAAASGQAEKLLSSYF